MLRLRPHRLSACLFLLAPLLFWQVDRVSATDVSFSGWLESVGNESIAIRLSDRRVVCAVLPKTALLSGNALSVQYKMGDQVEISCRTIQPVWEKSTSRYQYLEVTAIRLLERPSSGKLTGILAGIPFREGENLLERPLLPIPSAGNGLSGPGSAEFEQARRINLEYSANMPNFIADEIVKRYRNTAKSPRWSNFDTLQTEIAFQGNRTIRRQVRRNGKPWDQPFESLPGFKWYGGFGSEIRPVFDPQCPTSVEYEGRSQAGGRQLWDYRYDTPVDGCFPFFYYQYQRYNPQRTGHIRIDPSGNVVELDEEARGFPAEFELAGREEHIYWDSVKIGEGSHWVPVRATCVAAFYSGTSYRIEVEFRNHRHFESSTNVTFH